MEVSWKKNLEWETSYSADSVEWCPIEPYRNVLVCGTYQLQNTDGQEKHKSQTRLGKMYLFTIDKNTPNLFPKQTVETSGILDQKWCHHKIQNYPVLGIVTSDGKLHLYRLVDENGSLSLKLWIGRVISQSVLALSLDWSSNKTSSEQPGIVVSDSSGSVHLLRVVGEAITEIGIWKSHGFEAWITAFNYWNEDIFYSGGDDCVFKCYDARVPDVATVTNRTHEAGVTVVRSHVDVEHELLTGSYDEKVRLWDARHLKRCINEVDVKGGVWRLKYHPHQSSLILAACMYGGFRILCTESRSTNVVGEYLEHQSIAYGADWKWHDRDSIVATCSFYDCKLHISELSFKEK